MRSHHEDQLLIWSAIASLIISLSVVVLGFWYGNKLQDKAKNEEPPVVRNESPESKLLMVAMRCQRMEQDNDMLRLRIEELEDTIAAITNKDRSVCGQYYIYTSAHTEDSQQKEVYNPLAVDDLVPLTEEK